MKSAGASPTGIVLTGGGARAAYQVGVLAAVLRIMDPHRSANFRNPFPIICGTSAGAINAAALACRANDVHLACDRLRELWEGLHTGLVYKADSTELLRTGARWLGLLTLGWLMPGLRGKRPASLLDNRPLEALLTEHLDFQRLEANLKSDVLTAVAIAATGYTTGEHITFYQSKKSIEPWTRSLRHAVACNLGVDHLMASSSIPFVFPPRALLAEGRTEWCGGGSMRQLAPLSPAIHLGASRIFVISTAHRNDTHLEDAKIDSDYPSLAQISGHALTSIFLDSLSADLERLHRLNDLLAVIPQSAHGKLALKPVSVLSITPSQSLDDIAMRHLHQMPPPVRTLLRVLGVSSGSQASNGGALVSYLLFEAGYTRELIRLGFADSMKRIDEVKAFFRGAPQ